MYTDLRQDFPAPGPHAGEEVGNSTSVQAGVGTSYPEALAEWAPRADIAPINDILSVRNAATNNPPLRHSVTPEFVTIQPLDIPIACAERASVPNGILEVLVSAPVDA